MEWDMASLSVSHPQFLFYSPLGLISAGPCASSTPQSFDLLRLKDTREKGRSSSWEQMVRAGSATTLAKVLPALFVSSSGNGDCDGLCCFAKGGAPYAQGAACPSWLS